MSFPPFLPRKTHSGIKIVLQHWILGLYKVIHAKIGRLLMGIVIAETRHKNRKSGGLAPLLFVRVIIVGKPLRWTLAQRQEYRCRYSVCYIPIKHELLNRCWFNVGPKSNQNWFNTVFGTLLHTKWQTSWQYLLTCEVSRYCSRVKWWLKEPHQKELDNYRVIYWER